MSKTQEELNEIKKEYESLASKLHELTEDEIKEVTGGETNPFDCSGYYFELDGEFKKDKRPFPTNTPDTEKQ